MNLMKDEITIARCQINNKLDQARNELKGMKHLDSRRYDIQNNIQTLTNLLIDLNKKETTL